jgi:arginine-tRNA-protein transferase
VRDFAPTRSQRRAVQKNADVRISWHRPTVTESHLELYNRHKQERDLSRDGQQLTLAGYYHWLVSSCTDTREARYWLGEQLIGVGIVDVGERASSSVYFYFDPEYSKRSLGVFSVLKEVEWGALAGRDWHYLGLYVADCKALNYKALYLPHERRIDGVWRRFSREKR